MFRYFRNPVLVLLARLGWFKIAYCSYHIHKDGIDYNMLGRARGGDLWILREVLVEETYRPILELLPTGPLRILDVGAHIGTFTVWLHRQHGVKEAFCFEPNSDSFSLCQFNVGQNGCANVWLSRQAMGGNTRESEMWVDAITHARSSLHRRATSSTTQQQRVQVIALNEWLQKVPGSFDLLKMDCEGAEWEMLRAAPAAFTRFSFIVAEIHDDPDKEYRIEDFAAALDRHGFATVRSDGLYIGRRTADTDRISLPQHADISVVEGISGVRFQHQSFRRGS